MIAMSLISGTKRLYNTWLSQSLLKKIHRIVPTDFSALKNEERRGALHLGMVDFSLPVSHNQETRPKIHNLWIFGAKDLQVTSYETLYDSLAGQWRNLMLHIKFGFLVL